MLSTYSDFPVLDEKVEHNRSVWGNWAFVVCPETVVGFNALHVADDCFYAVLAGPEERYNEILKFDFDGECVHRYCLPTDIVNIHCMTVDKGWLWAFVENKDGEIKLIKAGI